MQITTKGRYGLKAMLELSKNSSSSVLLTSKEISTNQNIPLRYLEKIICALKKNNLINSTRGAEGGYQLSRSAEKITVYEVLFALESNFSILSHRDAILSKQHLTFWHELEEHIKKALTIPLSEFAEREKDSNIKFMYYI